MRMRLTMALLAIVLFTLHLTQISAQVINAELVGTVQDQTKALVPNADVTAKNEATGVVYTGKTNSTGEYRIANLPTGVYDVTASAAGFTASKLTGLKLDVNKVSTANLTVEVAGVGSTVEVSTIASVAIDTTTSQLQTTFATHELADLPTSSFSPLNLSLLAPGVASPGGLGEGVGPSVAGQRPRNNNFTVDGVDNNNKGITGPTAVVPNDAEQEFSLLQNVFSAEFGHSNGGQFNEIIKSGSNQFHGVAYEYFQNRNLNATDYAFSVARGGDGKNPRFDDNRFGGQVGGPIIHDRLFFFSNFQKQPQGTVGSSGSLCVPTSAGRSALSSAPGVSANNLQFFLNVPTAPSTSGAAGAGCPTAPQGPGFLVNGNYIETGGVTLTAGSFTNGTFSTNAIDWTVGQKDSMRFRYIYNRVDGIDATASLPIFFAPIPFRVQFGEMSEDHVFSANLTNEIRFGFNRTFGPAVLAPGKFPGLAVVPNIIIDELGGIDIGPNPNGPQGAAQDFYEVIDGISYVHGRHTMKFGADLRKYISYTDFVQRARGEYEYSTAALFLTDGVPDGLAQRNASSGGSQRYYGDQVALYFYGQDDWRVTPKFTANLGLRYEFTSVPKSERLQALNIAASVPGLISFSKPKPQYTNFAPRIGFAYAPDENTSIRAGFAIGYDVLYDNIGSTSAPPQFQVTENVGDPGTNSSAPFLANGGLSATVPPFTDLATQRASTTTYIPNQKLPYAESYSLGVQHVFARNYTGEIRYVGTHGVHLDTQTQINKQAIATVANQLPTFFTPPSAGTIAALGDTNTLEAFLAKKAALGNIVPAYLNAGFTSTITADMPFGASNYNGLATSLTRRFQNGLLLNFAYTYSKTMDNATDDFNSIALTPRRAQDSQDYHAEWARSALDRTHRVTLAAIYDIPFFKHGNFVERNVLSNWEIAPVYTYESPEWGTAQSQNNANGNGDPTAASRTQINPAGNRKIGSGVTPIMNAQGHTVAYLADNPDAYYVISGPGTVPNASRNTIPTLPINNFDGTLVKRLAFTERLNFEFQAQVLNVLNHPQYIPGSTNGVFQVPTNGATIQNLFVPSNPNFGQYKNVFGSNPRIMVLVGKFIF